MGRDLHVAVVGLGFGAEFVPIYRHHPEVGTVTLVDPDPALRDHHRLRWGADRAVADLAEVLGDASVDAVHLVTPIPLHARQSAAVLAAGKHCACTVPAATSLADLQALVAARQRARKVYMMMETSVYTREFLMVRDWHARGGFGRIQFLRGAHYQDMEGWPSYWAGLPPMHYATHAVAPLAALAQGRPSRVRCLGSGSMRDELSRPYGNRWPVQTALLEFADVDTVAEITRSLFETARGYSEAFSVLGSERSFEWQQVESERPVRWAYGAGADGRGRDTAVERIDAPDRADLLPAAIRRFTHSGVYDASDAHRSFIHGGGHGGSHPHLVHEFISAIVAGRPSAIDAETAARWTAVGVCAHASAQAGGEAVEIPAFA